jgi:hypothetical protein
MQSVSADVLGPVHRSFISPISITQSFDWFQPPIAFVQSGKPLHQFVMRQSSSSRSIIIIAFKGFEAPGDFVFV